MASYYTESEARAFAARTVQKSARAQDSGVILREATAATSYSDRFDVFLSHATADSDLVLGVKAILEQKGIKVYVDWVDDPQLDRTHVTPETALLLRRRMRQSSALIWLATQAASDSLWMPWELGYFDGFRPDQVAVLPLVTLPNEAYKGQEYLSLYPVVRKDSYTNGQMDVFVEAIGQRWTSLSSFSTGAPNWNSY